ncbi:MAG: diguanylate cyclase [Sulfuricella denitrificans]|nr:diguanylate cyclase [Sulfuricella denitrificans]
MDPCIRNLIDAIPVPMALNDDAQNIIFLNQAFVQTFGYQPEDIPTLAEWWPKAYPDPAYRQSVADAWQNRLEQARASGAPFEPLEVKIHSKNGQVKTIVAGAAPVGASLQGIHLVTLYDISERVTAMNELAEARNVLQSIIETIPMRVFWKDSESRYLGCNVAFAADAGKSGAAEVVGQVDSQLAWHDQADLYRADDRQVMATGAPKLGYEEPQTTPSGELIWLRTSKVPLRNLEHEPIGVLGVYEDITAMKSAELEMRIAAVAFESQQGMLITDADGRILRVNRAFTRLTGYLAEEAIGQLPNILKSGRHKIEFYQEMWAELVKEGHWQGEIWNRRKSGEIYPEWLTISAVRNPEGKITNFIGSYTDITEQKAAEEEIRYLAFYDPLTSLPNRRLLTDRLRHALIASSRNGFYGAVMFLDLDNFKQVNDSLGHDVGDELLIEAARRLQAAVREGDTVARLGGDEFVVVLEDLHVERLVALGKASTVGDKILEALRQPYSLQGEKYAGSASMGIVLFLGAEDSFESLLRRADTAMYEAKKNGRDTWWMSFEG